MPVYSCFSKLKMQICNVQICNIRNFTAQDFKWTRITVYPLSLFTSIISVLVYFLVNVLYTIVYIVYIYIYRNRVHFSIVKKYMTIRSDWLVYTYFFFQLRSCNVRMIVDVSWISYKYLYLLVIVILYTNVSMFCPYRIKLPYSSI